LVGEERRRGEITKIAQRGREQRRGNGRWQRRAGALEESRHEGEGGRRGKRGGGGEWKERRCREVEQAGYETVETGGRGKRGELRKGGVRIAVVGGRGPRRGKEG